MPSGYEVDLSHLCHVDTALALLAMPIFLN